MASGVAAGSEARQAQAHNRMAQPDMPPVGHPPKFRASNAPYPTRHAQPLSISTPEPGPFPLSRAPLTPNTPAAVRPSLYVHHVSEHHERTALGRDAPRPRPLAPPAQGGHGQQPQRRGAHVQRTQPGQEQQLAREGLQGKRTMERTSTQGQGGGAQPVSSRGVVACEERCPASSAVQPLTHR